MGSWEFATVKHVVVAAAVCVLAGAYVPAAQDPPPGATIRGRVVAAASGDPIPGATVQAVSVGGDAPVTLRAGTDDQGYFQIADLPPGQYRVSASRTGFVARQLGQRGPFESVDPISVLARQVVVADFALVHGGAIMGRVFDQRVDPVADARVQAMRIQNVQGRQRLVPVGPVRLTDDLGVYRLFALPPGNYYVSATVGPDTLAATVGYPPSYFPGTPRIRDALRISVDTAEEEYNVNFALVPGRLTRVGGRVISGGGDPVSQARVELLPEIEGLLAGGVSALSGPDGAFAFGGVPPGTYTIAVVRSNGADAPPDLAWLDVEVDTHDVSDLIVVTNNGSMLTGSIATEGTGRPELSAIRALAQPAGSASGRGERAASVSRGVFQIGGLIGPYTISLEGLPQGFVLKSVSANGTDVTDVPLEFRGAEHIDMQVTLTSRRADLFGTVRAGGRGVPNASVVLFPDNPVRWTGASRSIRTARTDRDGLFAIRGLLANQRYLVAALEYLNDGEEQDPEFLGRIRPRASILGASPDQNRTIDLSIVTR